MICFHKNLDNVEMLRQEALVDDTITVGVRCKCCGAQATRRISNIQMVISPAHVVLEEEYRYCLTQIRTRAVWLSERLSWLEEHESIKTFRGRLRQAWALLRGKFWRDDQ